MKKMNNALMVNLSVDPVLLPEEVVKSHQDLCDSFWDFGSRLLDGL